MIARFLLGVLVALVAPTLSACRGTLGANCRCADDCRAGLACAAEGEKALGGSLCYDPGVVGQCIEVADADADADTGGVPTEPPMFADMPSKRDFQPGTSVSAGGTETGSETGTGTETGTSSGTETGSTTGTSTGETDTSTGTGTGTSTGTSTGTTGTSTGDTDTSTGTSSGSTTDSSGSSTTGGSSGESSSTG